MMRYDSRNGPLPSLDVSERAVTETQIRGMYIEVRTFGPVRETIERKFYRYTLESNATVGDLLEQSYPELDDVRAVLDGQAEGDVISVNITVNKRSLKTLEDNETALYDGTVVRLSPPIHSG
ncbi:MoaD/ThiS family protein [Halosolutus gelatinilyticus]|uniref:MoaD/ThiS family protein n=1 Tax=Halosolutus gelatinilyticus TaxID=2931975 RepID=UPI001FF6D921|nr:MoaD/ThiS family protein [Halosolutus gelatinilyticus]